ncbi:hypothetical protein GGX14DRAFT_543993 [Mycena pura]|uniref:Uncharacterized protein n=1 Tax=Mycena pura TaxID=153505 RepID=A0AAD6V8B4_9AGAR|nr:hypothetical protein GGX14DRAFT_543993 [Mycena pura]
MATDPSLPSMLLNKFPLTEAQIIGNWFETLAYGIYFVTCGFCARALLVIGSEGRWRKPNEVNWFMLSVAILLFVVGTFDVIIGLVHNLQAFVFFKGAGGAAQELMNISNWIDVARSITQVIQMILGDVVLIYRCYIVHARRWRIVTPSFLLYLSSVAILIKLIEVEASLHYAKVLNSLETHPWWVAFYGITVIQNIWTTGKSLYICVTVTDFFSKGLLIWPIWRVEQENAKYRVTSIGNSQSQLRKVIRVIAETGCAYTTMLLINFVIDVNDSNLNLPISDVTLQAAGIAFNVIIMRSACHRDEQFATFDTNSREGGLPHMLEFARGPNRSGITATLDVGHISLNLTGQLEVTGIESNYSSDRKAATEKVSGLSESSVNHAVEQ